MHSRIDLISLQAYVNVGALHLELQSVAEVVERLAWSVAVSPVCINFAGSRGRIALPNHHPRTAERYSQDAICLEITPAISLLRAIALPSRACSWLTMGSGKNVDHGLEGGSILIRRSGQFYIRANKRSST